VGQPRARRDECADEPGDHSAVGDGLPSRRALLDFHGKPAVFTFGAEFKSSEMLLRPWLKSGDIFLGSELKLGQIFLYREMRNLVVDLIYPGRQADQYAFYFGNVRFYVPDIGFDPRQSRFHPGTMGSGAAAGKRLMIIHDNCCARA
jgi:hypothetical protein